MHLLDLICHDLVEKLISGFAELAEFTLGVAAVTAPPWILLKQAKMNAEASSFSTEMMKVAETL